MTQSSTLAGLPARPDSPAGLSYGATAVPPPAELLMHFQSLGDNCEFGLLQRFCGAEPLGLLRFNWTILPSLLDVMADRFARIGEAELIEIYQEPSTQYMVRHHPYEFRYHTFLYPGDITVEKLAEAEAVRLRYLKRAFIEDLEEGSRILVRKGDDSQTLEAILPLLRAIRRYGPSPLLWVTRADAAHAAGLVERLEDGLLHGYVDRFAPYDDAYDVSVASWLDVCGSAWRLCHRPESVAAERPAPVPPAANLLAGSDSFAAGAFIAFDGARNARVPEPLAGSGPVLCHVLPDGGGAFAGELGGGPTAPCIVPGDIYTASAQMWLPASFGGEAAGTVIAGQRSVRIHNANLARRDCWQQYHVSALSPPGATALHPSLYVSGRAGDVVFTTAWKLERGIAPTATRPPTGVDEPEFAADPPAPPPARFGLLARLRAAWRRRNRPPPPGQGRAAPATVPDLLARFESLGDNCEFGAVQRQGGVEQLAFFRFASAGLAPLLQALEQRFATFGSPEAIAIRVGHGGEQMVTVQPYGFEYHTFLTEQDMAPGALRAAEVTRLGFLKRKLIEDLEAGEKIYVRKGETDAADIRALAAALRRYGRATLLWVTLADAANPAGTVQRLDETLLRGFIGRFAPGDAVMNAALHDWVEICRNADRLWRLAGAMRAEARVPRARPNLLPPGSYDEGATWFGQVQGQMVPAPRPLQPGCAIMLHAGASPGGTSPFGGMASAGLQPGAMHVISAWVWLPDRFAGTSVSLFVDGLPSIRIQGARLALRGVWQRIWTSVRLPPGWTEARPRLYLAAPPDSPVFSTCWKLEAGVVPTGDTAWPVQPAGA